MVLIPTLIKAWSSTTSSLAFFSVSLYAFIHYLHVSPN
jgi:hypothetical protein